MIDLVRVRDAAVSRLALNALDRYLGELGRMLNIVVDSKAKILRLEALPAGEKEPISIEIGNYALVEQGGAAFLTFEWIVTSREWINRLIETVLTDRSIPLPPGAPLALLRTLL